MTEIRPASSRHLACVVDLLAELEQRGVRYVHWKSNEHLEEALRGETDLDLLVHREDQSEFESTVREYGFVPMSLPRARRFPGRSGFLGFDWTTGSLAQLDVHHALVLGEQLVKNHHLPIEEWLLTDTTHLLGVQIPSAARESIVFYLRVCFKSTLRQRLSAAVRNTPVIPENIQREARWLAGQVDENELTKALDSVELPIPKDGVEEFFRRISNGGLEWRYLARTKRSLMWRLRRFQRRPAAIAWVWKGLLRFRSSRWARWLGLGIPSKRILGRAPFIAVVGADGSGKSRLTSDLTAWLRWKLAVRHLYLGQPKKGLLFKMLNKPGSIVRGMGSGRGSGILHRVSSATDAMKWVYLASRRRRLVSAGLKAAGDGEVVFAERFPLEEFWAMPVPMDGPRLQSRSSRLSSLELKQYSEIPRPDVILVLAADLETLRGRKTDLGVPEHRSKADAVLALEEGPGVHVIDAGRPYSDVLLEAKRRVWEAILAAR